MPRLNSILIHPPLTFEFETTVNWFITPFSKVSDF